ncbi:MAG: type II toxin-antitoxin system RelE/ParE family toxin [Planctomycetota bacterium]|jgi:proteic killer suppression protein
MIQSFGDRRTEDLFDGLSTSRVRRLPPHVASAAARRLDALGAAARLGDLAAVPGHRLERLRGDRAGCHSIRVNRQWRLVFRWTEEGPEDVELVDYHGG